ncbi:hypothetical protein OC845_005036 [Tilletia horrida]|nr:hypothetical protein OC845_005036 [Tilletia horrida]
MTSSTSTAPIQTEPPLTLDLLRGVVKSTQQAAALHGVKPTHTDQGKTNVDNGKSTITDTLTGLSPLNDVVDAIKQVQLGAIATSQADSDQLQFSDLAGIPQDLVAIFNELATWTAIAGPFLKIGLGVIAEILKIAQEVRTNKDACEDFSKKVMGIFWEFAFAAKASGCPILTGTASALILERAIQQLRAFRAQIEVYASWGTVKRTLKRGEIKAKLDDLNKEMDALVVRVGTQNAIVLTLRSDYDRVGAPASGQTEAALTSSSGMSTHAPNASAIPQMVLTQITTGFAIIGNRPTHNNDSASSDLLTTARPGLERLSAAVKTELNRRSFLHATSADDHSAQQTEAVSPARPVYSMTSSESAQLKLMQDRMRQLYSRGGDGADLIGVFDNRRTAEGGANPASDPGQIALELLDVLGSASTSSGKDTVNELERLLWALGDLGLFEEAVEVATLLTALCRRKWSESGYPRDRANLASVLLDLASSFSQVGRYDEADASSSEALTIFRDMARREPKKYNPMLATTLRIRSVHDARAGRAEEALRLIRHSIEIYRSLCRDHPHVYEDELSSALLSYSVDLGQAGKHEEALGAIEECVKIRKALYQARPAQHEAGLAGALLNYSFRLSKEVRQQEALVAAKESVKMYRTLHQARPVVYEAGLARALDIYSSRLSDVGEDKEALAAMEECVRIQKSLYQARPAAYTADLAGALVNYSFQLSVAGRHEEALAAIETCVEMYTALHQARPAAYEGSLAGALLDYSTRLIQASRQEEALAMAQKSVQMFKILHKARPEAYRADLARALFNYSARLNDAGKHKEALAAIEECVKMRKVLHQVRPAAYGADLARALSSYANRLSDVGKHDEALASNKESIKMYRSLRQARSGLYEEDLARVLLNYSSDLSDAGRAQEALAATGECVKIRKALYQARPAAHEEALARALRNYSIDLSHAGRHKEALQAIEESLVLYQRLNKSRPEAFQQPLQRAEGTRDWIRRPESGLHKTSRGVPLKTFWKG